MNNTIEILTYEDAARLESAIKYLLALVKEENVNIFRSSESSDDDVIDAHIRHSVIEEMERYFDGLLLEKRLKDMKSKS